MNLACCVLALALTGADDQTKEIWSLTAPTAIRIALDNSEFVRVIAQGKQAMPVGTFLPTEGWVAPPPAAPVDFPKGMTCDRSSIVIGRLNADAAMERFKSEVMALVRSVEQQYWRLAEADRALWAADQAVSLAQEVIDFEQADFCLEKRDSDVADVKSRLEQFQQTLVDRKSDAETAERQLRELLGLPKSDNRQIIPVDQPIKEHVVFDLHECVDSMLRFQPDIIQQEAIASLAQDKLTTARKAFADAAAKPEIPKDRDVNRVSMYTFSNGSRAPLANTRQMQYAVIRSQEFLDQVIQRTTKSLTRAIDEVESGYERYAKAKHLRIAAEDRLKVQRVYWDDGRIASDRYLDAVVQYTTLVANEHHHLAVYNSALTVVNACRGTLLEDRNIIVVEPRARAIGAQ
jgi:outer membrane protein TolC